MKSRKMTSTGIFSLSLSGLMLTVGFIDMFLLKKLESPSMLLFFGLILLTNAITTRGQAEKKLKISQKTSRILTTVAVIALISGLVTFFLVA